MKNLTFEERVIKFLKLDDDSKVLKFKKQAVKTWEEQVAIRQKELDELNDKKEELQDEKAQEIVLNVDITQLGTIDAREAYLASYQQKLFNLKSQLDSYDAKIENKLKEIETFTWAIDQLATKEVED